NVLLLEGVLDGLRFGRAAGVNENGPAAADEKHVGNAESNLPDHGAALSVADYHYDIGCRRGIARFAVGADSARSNPTARATRLAADYILSQEVNPSAAGRLRRRRRTHPWVENRSPRSGHGSQNGE